MRQIILTKNFTFCFLPKLGSLILLAIFFSNVSFAENIDALQTADSGTTGFVNFDGFQGKGSARIHLKMGAHLGKLEQGRHFLRLRMNAFAEFRPPENVSADKGTISVWIKPLWNENDKESHTIASMRWQGDDSSYMAISQGWWEPNGESRLYFILSNQDHIHCSSEYSLQTNVWSMITVTWLTGTNGFCEVYVNDERIARSNTDKSVHRFPAGSIFIGTDRGSTLPAGRKAQFDLFGIKLVNRPLPHDEIYSIYSKAVKSRAYLSAGRWNRLNPASKNTGDNTQNDRPEARVIFDESSDWALSRNNTDEILGRISAAGFNVYIPCVWHGRGTYYPTAVGHVNRRIQQRIDGGDDPLLYLVRKAHGLGIEVHPWFTVVKREDDTYPRFYDEGTPKGAYNVHIPEFRSFVVDLMLEAAKRYAIDGINLDYIRAMGICLSDFCSQDYKNKYDAILKLDYIMRAVSNSARNRIQFWQDAAINDIVKRLSENIREINPEITLSVDTHPVADNSKRALEGLDAIRIANSGMVDVIYNMDYQKVINIENVTRVRRAMKQPDKLITLFGNYERIGKKVIPRDPLLIKKYIELARSRWPNSGIAFYLYSKLSDDQVKLLASGPFKTRVLPRWEAGNSRVGE